METKLDSRQGQFPASFPDTFKNFFAMMSEDEDHMDLFSNMLEDKMIPRANKFNQRRCGGSLRCTTSHSNNTTSAGSNHNVGRSSSFRVTRNRVNIGSGNVAAGKVNKSGSGNLIELGVACGSGSVANTGDNLNSPTSFCKHIKYCCLHQQHQQHQQQQQQHYTSNQQIYQQQKQQQQQQHQYSQPNIHDYGGVGSATRLGPDGEDNQSCGLSGSETNNGQQLLHQQQQQQQQTAIKSQQQKRHSIILERAFDFDASCDESDTISTASSTPTTTNIPYSILTRPPPILKQPHHSLHQHQQLQQQQSSLHKGPITKEGHRTLPQPPRGAGVGAFHTRETALQRIQQQCGLTAGSKTNLAALSNALGSSVNNVAGSSSVTETVTLSATNSNSVTASTATGQQHIAGGNNNSYCIGSSSSSSSNNYNNMNYSNGDNIIGGNGSGFMYNTSGAHGSGRNLNNLYMDLHSPTATPSPSPVPPQNSGIASTTTTAGAAASAATTTMQNKFNDLLSCGTIGTSRSNLGSIRTQKSPILNRRRSSSITANLLTADIAFNRNSGSNSAADDDDFNIHSQSSMPHSSNSGTRDRIAHAKSPMSNKPNRIPVEGGVLTFQQAMSGAVSPQYSATSPMHTMGHDMGSSATLAALIEGTATTSANCMMDSPTAESPTSKTYGRNSLINSGAMSGSGGVAVGSGGSVFLCGSAATIAQFANKQRQRLRTSSMPAESRKPRLADTRRAAIHCADIDLDYYRLRSFSITSHGVCNLGDSLRSRRSRSINSVTSTGTSNSGKDRHNSNASRTSGDVIFGQSDKRDPSKAEIPAYKIAMLGASGVGKTTLTYQFTTSDYICAYDLSLDDDYGQKTVSVLVDGIETDLEIIDHPACEMSTEAFCSTYNIDLFVVVYSVVDRNSFKAAEKVLQYLKENEMLLTRGAILVGNKTDLERHREVTRQMGRKVAKEIACKFIETSSGLDHNVDELLVGIVAQVKLNPQRIRNLSERDRQRLNLQSTIQKHRRMHLPARRIVRQMSMCQQDDGADADIDVNEDEMERDENQPYSNNSNNAKTLSSNAGDEGIATGSEHTASTSLSTSTRTISSTKGPIRKTNKRTLNLESILKMGESELEDEEENTTRHHSNLPSAMRPVSKFELLTSGKGSSGGVIASGTSGGAGVRTPFGSLNSSPKSRKSYESNSGGSGVSRGSGRNAVINTGNGGNRFRNDSSSQAEENLLPDCNRKTVSKLTNRTKVFLSSVLRFKKAINVKRRSSSSCSDLFVI